MITKNVEKILNEQIEKEGYSSNLYLSMASWAETEGYAGISKWLYAQAEEELLHMMKFVHFINERSGHAIIPAFKQPPAKFEGIKKLFDQVLEHEEYITKSINDIVALAIKENDFASHNWLQWFVTEQVEEEASVHEIIDKLNLLGEGNMYLFDRDIMSLRGASE
ncbi:MAG: ferritin [Bacteroidales bacterium]|jgi:ferritin|nr:ferritin [Bacteroidales bacterium]